MIPLPPTSLRLHAAPSFPSLIKRCLWYSSQPSLSDNGIRRESLKQLSAAAECWGPPQCIIGFLYSLQVLDLGQDRAGNKGKSFLLIWKLIERQPWPKPSSAHVSRGDYYTWCLYGTFASGPNVPRNCLEWTKNSIGWKYSRNIEANG